MAKLKRQIHQNRKPGLKNRIKINKNKKIEFSKKNTSKDKSRKEMQFSKKNTSNDESRKEMQFSKKNTPKDESRKGKKVYSRKVEEEEEEEGFDIAPANVTASFVPAQSAPKDGGGDDIDTRILVKVQNRKQQKTKKQQSGGFQSMGLSHAVYTGIMKKGYKVPTPIQRKTISLIMDGKDVVAMARTGSGKTGAFLIPMLEKLNVHSSQAVRAIILSPTRELALQTAKFTHELGKYSDLKSTLIVGGDSIENQFAALHQNPDILIATPGRLLHLLVEMDIKKLDAIEYVVFDEADRLFEMGFAEQLKEIIQRLPQSRQTVLFSATLPKVLVDFATAGLNDPTLVRLDVDTKISEKLKTAFILLRNEDKIACLLHMLQKLIKPEELTVIFVSTRHHVDYLHELLNSAGLVSSYIYSSLDQTARKINLSKFRSKTTKILVVTDIAARGIDVPMLDNVINFDFPPRPKIFVHRVGRVARAGRYGNAYSFVMKDELPFLMDLHLFLGRPIKYADSSTDTDADGVIGTVPQGMIVNELDFIRNTSQTNYNLTAAHKVMTNGYKQYIKSREAASVESNKRARQVDMTSLSTHPCFCNATSETNEELSKLLLDLRKFKPALTVFESITTKKSKDAETVMHTKRKHHGTVIEREQLRQQQDKPTITTKKSISSISDDKYIADAFNIQKKDYKGENYIPRQASDNHQEKGLSLTSFEKEATHISMELTGDDGSALRAGKANKKWDRKRKKFVGVDNPHAKKFKTESGNYIPSSYKSDRYNDWMKKTHFSRSNDNEENEEGANRIQTHGRMNKFRNRGGYKNVGNIKTKGTLKSKDQIIRQRLKDDTMKSIRNKSSKGKNNSRPAGRTTNMAGRKPKTGGGMSNMKGRNAKRGKRK